MTSPDDLDLPRRIAAAVHQHERDIVEVVPWRPPATRPRRTRRWLPVLAVAAVVVTVAVVIAALTHGRSAGPPRPAAPLSTDTNATTDPGQARALDVSYIGDGSGFALARTRCAAGHGTCTAVLHVDVRGRWSRLPSPPFAAAGVTSETTGDAGSSASVQHLVFANSTIGYVYGPTTLYRTADGGRTWARQAGGADAITISRGTAIRASINNVARPAVQTAAIESSTWTTLKLPGGTPVPAIGGSVSLSSSSDLALLAVVDYVPSKGNGVGQHATLLVSDDAGRAWTRHGDPCPAVTGQRNDSTAAADVAPDGSIVIDCGIRSNRTTGDTIASSTITSTDAGRTYSALQPHPGLPEAAVLAAADRSHQIQISCCAGGSRQLHRTDDGGQTWTAVGAVPLGPEGPVRTPVASFRTVTAGSLIGANGSIWTTRDSGRSWTRQRLP